MSVRRSTRTRSGLGIPGSQRRRALDALVNAIAVPSGSEMVDVRTGKPTRMRVGVESVPYLPAGEKLVGTADLRSLYGERARSIELALLADNTAPKLPGLGATHYYLASDATRVANTIKESSK